MSSSIAIVFYERYASEAKQSHPCTLGIASTGKERWSPNDRLANFPTGSKSFKKLCELCVLSGENLSPNYTDIISE